MRDAVWYGLVILVVIGGLVGAVGLNEFVASRPAFVPWLVHASLWVLSLAAVAFFGLLAWAFLSFFGAVRELVRPR
jgi:hypothetical protein